MDTGKMTVSQYLDHYLAAVAPGLEAGTLSTKKYSLAHWRKLVGNIPLAKPTRLDVQKAANNLPERLSPLTRRSVYMVFRATMRQDGTLGYVAPRSF